MADRTPIDDKLRQAWSRERSWTHLRGLCAVATGFFALLLAYVFLDWLLNVPWIGRLVLAALIAALVGFIFHRRWFKELRPFDPARVALQVERCNPSLSSLLISYVQLSPERAGVQASPRMLEAIRQKAVDAALPLDFESFVDFNALRVPFVLASAAVGVFLVLGAADFEYVSTALLRLVSPDAKYPTRTRIEVLTTKLTVPQGAPVELRFRGLRMVPAEGSLQVRFDGDGRVDQATLLREEGNDFVYRIDRAQKSFDFTFALGDATTDTLTMRVITAPAIKSFKVVATFPEYTHHPVEEQDKTLNLSVLEGTTIEWRMTLDKPVERIWTQMDKPGDPPQTHVDANGSDVVVSWKAGQSVSYRFGFTPKGYAYDFLDELEHTVDVKPDEPPQVEILKPGRDEKATVNWSAPLAFRASDDYGVAQARLVFWKEVGQEQQKALGAVSGKSAELQTEWSIKDALPGLQAGDVLNYCVEVSDNFPGKKGPHWGRSPVQQISILSTEDFAEWVLSQRELLNGQMDSIMKSEETDSQGLKETELKLKSGTK